MEKTFVYVYILCDTFHFLDFLQILFKPFRFRTRIFDVEMQMSDTLELPKRSRYYQSVCDMDSLEAGKFYSDLKESYVIFICPFDLFGKELPCYNTSRKASRTGRSQGSLTAGLKRLKST